MPRDSASAYYHTPGTLPSNLSPPTYSRMLLQVSHLSHQFSLVDFPNHQKHLLLPSLSPLAELLLRVVSTSCSPALPQPARAFMPVTLQHHSSGSLEKTNGQFSGLVLPTASAAPLDYYALLQHTCSPDSKETNCLLFLLLSLSLPPGLLCQFLFFSQLSSCYNTKMFSPRPLHHAQS